MMMSESALAKGMRGLALVATSRKLAVRTAAPSVGNVYIVGMGTTPDLITVRDL
jgi:hypothetical protein